MVHHLTCAFGRSANPSHHDWSAGDSLVCAHCSLRSDRCRCLDLLDSDHFPSSISLSIQHAHLEHLYRHDSRLALLVSLLSHVPVGHLGNVCFSDEQLPILYAVSRHVDASSALQFRHSIDQSTLCCGLSHSSVVQNETVDHHLCRCSMDSVQFVAVAPADGHRNGKSRPSPSSSPRSSFRFSSVRVRDGTTFTNWWSSLLSLLWFFFWRTSWSLFGFINRLVEHNRNRLKLERKPNNSAAVIFISFDICSWWSAFFSAVGHHSTFSYRFKVNLPSHRCSPQVWRSSANSRCSATSSIFICTITNCETFWRIFSFVDKRERNLIDIF